MNFIKKVLLFITILAGCCSLGQAQKAGAVKNLLKAPGSTPQELLVCTRQFMRQNQGRLPRKIISNGAGRAAYTYNLNPQQQWEVRLARQVYYQITKKPQPQDRSWRQLKYLYSSKETKLPMPTPEEFLPVLQAWVKAHNGRKPRLNIYENGQHLSVEEMRQKDAEDGSSLYEEYTLARLLAQFMKKGVPDKKTRDALAAIEELPTITHWQTQTEYQLYDWFGNALPSQYELLAQLQAWSAAHGNTKPRALFYQNGKRLTVEQLKAFPELYEEYKLGARLRHVLSKGGQAHDLKNGLEAINSLPVYHATQEK